MNGYLLKALAFTLALQYADYWNAHVALSHLHDSESDQNTALVQAWGAVRGHRMAAIAAAQMPTQAEAA